MMPAQARVLQGYFDGTLKIQFTKLIDFNTLIYADLMNSLLRWDMRPHMATPLWKLLYQQSQRMQKTIDTSHSPYNRRLGGWLWCLNTGLGRRSAVGTAGRFTFADRSAH